MQCALSFDGALLALGTNHARVHLWRCVAESGSCVSSSYRHESLCIFPGKVTSSIPCHGWSLLHGALTESILEL